MTYTLAEFAMLADVAETLSDMTHAGDDEMLARGWLALPLQRIGGNKNG